MMGMFSAVMGGVIRDTLTNEVPIIFRKEIYATACLAGAIGYWFLHYYQVPPQCSLFTSFGPDHCIAITGGKIPIELTQVSPRNVAFAFLTQHLGSYFEQHFLFLRIQIPAVSSITGMSRRMEHARNVDNLPIK